MSQQTWADHVTVLGPCRLCGREMISSTHPLCQAQVSYDFHVVPGRDFCIRCYQHDPCDVGWVPQCCGVLCPVSPIPDETMCKQWYRYLREKDGAV